MTDLATAPDIASVGGIMADDIVPWARAAGDVLYKATAAEIAAYAAAGGGSGLIATVTTAGSAASVDFSAIPGTFANLLLLAYCASEDTNTGNTQNTTVHFNGDTTGGHYAATGQGLYGGGPVGFPSAGGLNVPAGDAAGGYFGQMCMEINGYALDPFTKTWNGRSAFVQVNVGICASAGSGLWTGTGAITDITLAPTGGFAWKDGSKFWLYGR